MIESVIRSTSGTFELGEPASAGSLGVLRGIGAVFGEWAEVNNPTEGRFMESVAPGAFARAIAGGLARIKAVFSHGQDQQAGLKPLGPLIELEERSDGLHYAVDMLDTSYNRDILPGLRAGLYGSSVRMRIHAADRNRYATRSAANPRGLEERVVRDATLIELGPTLFPVYAGTSAGMRSRAGLWTPAARRRALIG